MTPRGWPLHTASAGFRSDAANSARLSCAVTRRNEVCGEEFRHCVAFLQLTARSVLPGFQVGRRRRALTTVMMGLCGDMMSFVGGVVGEFMHRAAGCFVADDLGYQ